MVRVVVQHYQPAFVLLKNIVDDVFNSGKHIVIYSWPPVFCDKDKMVLQVITTMSVFLN